MKHVDIGVGLGLALAAFCFGMAVATLIHWVTTRPVEPPRTQPAQQLTGPQCTRAFPRGFKLTKKMRKLPTCHMDIDGIVWGRCARRIET